MNRLFLNVLLAIAWVLFTRDLSVLNILAGFAIFAFLIVLVEPRRLMTGYGRQLVRGVPFALFYVLEVVLSSLRVARDVLHPHPLHEPAIVAVPLEEAHTDASITVLGNLVTMTPGTMSLDVSEDRHWLYIHAMYVGDVEHFRKDFKRSMEDRVLGVMK